MEKCVAVTENTFKTVVLKPKALKTVDNQDVTAFTSSADGIFIAYGTSNKIYVIERSTSEVIKEIKKFFTPGRVSLEFDLSSSYLWAVQEGVVQKWDVKNCFALIGTYGSGNALPTIAGEEIYYYNRNARYIIETHLSEQKDVDHQFVEDLFSSGYRDLVISPRYTVGYSVAVGVTLWDHKNLSKSLLPTQCSPIEQIKINPNQTILSITEDRMIEFWSLGAFNDPKVLKRMDITGHREQCGGAISQIEFFHHRKNFLTLHEGGSAILWDFQSFRPMRKLNSYPQRIRRINISQDDQMLNFLCKNSMGIVFVLKDVLVFLAFLRHQKDVFVLSKLPASLFRECVHFIWYL
mmetsp:Transcript_10734/g.11702  ORF Transcript_10734/g.11702 Transcript_10734/m.11702 type:complete len:350 (-) Transcript_10734:311-1360(-)